MTLKVLLKFLVVFLKLIIMYLLKFNYPAFKSLFMRKIVEGLGNYESLKYEVIPYKQSPTFYRWLLRTES